VLRRSALDRHLAGGEHDRVRPRVLLLDIDGVLYVEDETVAGAVAAVERLHAAGRTLRLVTNTTNRARLRSRSSHGWDSRSPRTS